MPALEQRPLLAPGSWSSLHCCSESNFEVRALHPVHRVTFSLDLLKNPVDGFSAGLVDENNIYEWDIMIMGPPDTL